MFFFDPSLIILAKMQHELREKEEARLRSLPPEQQAFELRLREVKAQEAIARKQTVINVKSSIF